MTWYIMAPAVAAAAVIIWQVHRAAAGLFTPLDPTRTDRT